MSKRALPLIALFLGLASCGVGSSDERSGDDPVAAIEAFLGDIERGDCDAAWTFFSRPTQENTVAQVRRAKRNATYAGEVIPTPQQKYCQGTYGGAKPGSAELVSQNEAAAVVSVLFAEGTHLPLIPFLSTPYREWRDSIELVSEDGRWKVARPLMEVGRPGWKLVEVGDVEVAWHLGGDPRREWVQAEAVSRAPRDALEAALMDPSAWPRFMPLVEAVEPQSGPDADGGSVWRLRFRAPDGTVAATIVRVRPYGRLRDPDLPWTTVQWTVEGHDDRGSTPEKPLFTGSWEVRPRFEGVWVTFGIVIQPDEWPVALPPEFLSEVRMAAALTDLERVAAALRSRGLQ